MGLKDLYEDVKFKAIAKKEAVVEWYQSDKVQNRISKVKAKLKQAKEKAKKYNRVIARFDNEEKAYQKDEIIYPPINEANVGSDFKYATILPAIDPPDSNLIFPVATAFLMKLLTVAPSWSCIHLPCPAAVVS